MPDITMCASQICDVRAKCYRNEASGTRPSEFVQSWFYMDGVWGVGPGVDEACEYYWPRK